jgi:MFS family permease
MPEPASTDQPFIHSAADSDPFSQRESLNPEPTVELSTALSSPRTNGLLASTFRSLRHRNYRLYFFGQLISLLGTWMQTTALMWLAFELTAQSTWVAMVAAAQIVPTFLLGAWGGSLADLWPKRSLIFVTQSAFLLLALLLAGLVLAGAVTPWQLVAVTAAAGLVQAVDLPARLAFVIDLTGRHDLMNAVALNSLLFNVARALGPALAGLLLVWIGPAPCFLANAASYLAVLWALVRMEMTSATSPGRVKERASILGGIRSLDIDRELVFLILLAFTTALCGWPVISLLPALAQHVLHSETQGYSFMLSSIGIGALAAAWAVATFGSLEHRARLIGAGVVLVSAALVTLSFSRNLIVAIGCCAVVGFGLILFLATSQTVVQLGTADHNRGRIMGIWAMALSGAMPLGTLFAGRAADRWGEAPVLLCQGIGCAAAALALVAIFRPRVRSLSAVGASASSAAPSVAP